MFATNKISTPITNTTMSINPCKVSQVLEEKEARKAKEQDTKALDMRITKHLTKTIPSLRIDDLEFE